jgi:predicted nucleic acid-binding protein
VTLIADTGPLVALFDSGDAYHDWAKRGLGRVSQALITSESVVSEVLFLLAGLRRSRTAFLGFWSEGGLRVVFEANRDPSSLVALLHKYADVPMSLADASIVRLSELNPDAKVWTLDADFKIYRRFTRRVVPLFDWPR